jgi:hypothetical protein
MSKYDFLQLFDNTIKKADKFLTSPSDESMLKAYGIYSSSLKQLTQVLKALDDKDEIRPEIEHLLKVHKDVENRLIKEKESLFKTIRSTLCRAHVRHKYHSDNIKSSLVDRKF